MFQHADPLRRIAPVPLSQSAEQDGVRRALKDKGRRTALVLAGGGITGAFYEVGALKALNDFMDGTFVTDFDIFVGTSSGAFIAASLANGISPEEMFRSLHTEAGFLSQLKRAAFFHPDYEELWRKVAAFPATWLSLTRKYLANLEEMTYIDYLLSFFEVMPAGILSNAGLETHFRKIFSRPPFVDRFDQIRKELFITAVDLDAGRRVVFGAKDSPDVRISTAIRAASALPVIYSPVRIDGIDYVDGAVRRTLNVDVAIERGADLIFLINPLMPLHNTYRESCVPLASGSSRHIRTKGLSFIADQVMRLSFESRVLYGLNVYRAQHPEVDILLIQPEPRDFKMFFYRYFQYSHRIALVEHGYASARSAIMSNYEHWRRAFDQHDIRLSQGLVEYELGVMNRAGAQLWHADPATLEGSGAETLDERLGLSSNLAGGAGPRPKSSDAAARLKISQISDGERGAGPVDLG
ncbi:MAG: patatin-like phospholipase family protein [Candidatus Schekmanbacteria bacterium]|nr:patatin-like phospholipase family protein [Candidatus Schekmanbacteria bacterium]